MNKFEEIVAFVRQHCGQSVDIDEAMTPRGVRIQASDLHKVCEKLHEDPAMYFDMLSCVTAVDNGVEAGTIDIVYNLYSIPFNSHFTLKVVVSREQPELDTVSDIWKTANWHEREAWDLLGVKFRGHPDLRRILLPADWEGHPLRKDYKHAEYYRDIKVD